jgi:uncharacterized protein (TIGR02996 family)
MTIERAFLDDIIAHPEDDAPRLIYADWLDEHGDEARAEFIRVQVALAKKRLPAGAGPRRDLQRREKALFRENGPRWAEAYGRWGSKDLVHWRRGFPWEARIFHSPSLDRVLAEIPAAAAAAPIQGLSMSLPAADAAGAQAVAATLATVRLRKLEVWGKYSPHRPASEMDRERRVASRMLASPHLSGLEELELRQMAGGPSLVPSILRLERLKSLYLYLAEMNDDVSRRLARSPVAGRLEGLCLGADFTSAAAQVVATSDAFVNLRTLDFNNSHIRDDGAVALARSPHLANLRELLLHSCEIGDRGLVALGQSAHLSSLRTLQLSQNGFSDRAMIAFARSTTLPRSLYLDLWPNEPSPATCAALRERFRQVNFDR